MDVDEDQFHSQIYTNKFHHHHNDIENNNNNNADSTVVAAEVQQQQQQQRADDDDHNHQLFRGWHNSSRIFRVSRASGGKDRHSKVLTSKGLRDRRVRLSVSTAIQFYDLQDRLGYDQPSKAVEWLIKAAADSIAELPSLHDLFPDCVDAKLGFHHESSSVAADEDSQIQQQKNLSASSTSETSKGSGLSLTRTDVRVNQRVKARARARERAKEKENESDHQAVHDGQRGRTSRTSSSVANPISSSSTFTELLTGGNQSGSPSHPNNSTTQMMDYFTNAGLISAAPARSAACLFLGQTQMGISMNNMPPAFHLTTGEHHNQHDVHHFSFGQQNLIASGNNDHQYDLNFTISPSSPSGLAAGFNNRGTLQSNSPASSLLHHHNLHQRYTNNNNAAAVSMQGSNVPAFFMTTTTAPSSMNNHHFSTGLDGGLHLHYGDHNDKGKN